MYGDEKWSHENVMSYRTHLLLYCSFTILDELPITDCSK